MRVFVYIMRKITADAIRAFRNGQRFKRGNTQVLVEGDSYKKILHPARILCLHGHVIAEMDNNGDLWINDGGWQSVTTKERLNGFPSVNIVQKNFQWFLNGVKWDGNNIKVDW